MPNLIRQSHILYHYEHSLSKTKIKKRTELSNEDPSIRKILVLCIDRDNDIGDKAKIVTPVIGRTDSLNAATQLALSDPEEADSNAIFAAIRQYDILKKLGQECQVAIVAGIHNGGLEADKKVRQQVKSIKKNFDADGLILISDGSDDELVIPIIQNLIPVISIKRVLVKHSKSLEETYAVIGKYLRMLAYDSRYSRIFLGVPGIFLLLSGLAIVFNQERIVALIALGLLGVTFLIRGFDIDKWFESLPRLKPTGYIRLFSLMASLLIVATSFFTAFVSLSSTEAFSLVSNDPNLIWQYSPFLIGTFVQNSLNILWIGLAVFFAGGMLVNYLKGSIRYISNFVGIIILSLLYFPVLQFSEILTGRGSTATLISFLLIGFAVIFLTATIIYIYIQSHRRKQEE